MFTTKNTITFDQSPLTWQAAVKAGVAVLVKNGQAQPALADAIFAATKVHGAYWVLMPGLALAHAPVGDYNLAPGIAAVILPHNIQVNNEDKWARIFIVLSAVDQTSHLHYIQQFGTTFQNPARTAQLLKAKTSAEFLTTYQQQKGGVNDY